MNTPPNCHLGNIEMLGEFAEGGRALLFDLEQQFALAIDRRNGLFMFDNISHIVCYYVTDHKA